MACLKNASASGSPDFQTPFCCFLALCPQARCSASLSVGFLTCKMGT